MGEGGEEGLIRPLNPPQGDFGFWNLKGVFGAVYCEAILISCSGYPLQSFVRTSQKDFHFYPAALGQ